MIKIEKRDLSSNNFAKGLYKLLSFLIGLAMSTVLLKLLSVDITQFFIELYQDSLGSKYAVSETLLKATPLIICSIGVSLAFKMKLWNIGSEGQLYMGALASTIVALYIETDSSFIMLSSMILASFLLGGLWSGFAAILKSKLNVNEIIVTLLMNYIAILLVDYLVYGPLKDPAGFNFPYTKQFPDVALLSTFFNTRLHYGVIIAVILLVIYYIIIEKSIWGYEIRVIGSNPNAAKYSGINIDINIFMVMFLSGGISALAGFSEVSGVIHRLQHSISPGYGYTAIIIAWLSNQNYLGILFSSIFMAILFIAGDTLQLNYQLPISLVNAFQGIILFMLLISDFFMNHKISIKWRKND
ncbi:MAG: ABC transporter permease [Calditerrivibrio sp.]|nr:ABC transporter permease [Calditerrivibrio sp.]MCA1932128.1 ABC transporter permease [Calditerrivibrio sp.]MCA1981027.1 ABC transporter permease [Calditerrivibrio sp.]